MQRIHGAPSVKIGLFGNFGSGNFGNDGSLEAMINFLRSAKPDAELVCICEDPAKVQELFDIPAIPIRSATRRFRFVDRIPLARTALNLLHTIVTARKFDILVAPGTGLLDDFSDSPWGMPTILASWCAGARLAGAKIAFANIGAGPIVHPLSRRLMKAAARMAHYRSYRDFESKEFLRSIGLDTRRDPVYPDLAFGLPSPPARTVPLAQGTRATVGVGVMRYYGWRGDKEQGADIYRTYLQKLVQFVLWLLDNQFHVRLLIGDDADQITIDDFLNALALARPDYPRAAVIYRRANTLQDVMNQIADTSFVVATRFHNVVSALKLRKPCISIGYARKFEVLMAEMDLSEFCQHIERLDVELLIRQFEALLANQRLHEQALDKVNKGYERSLSHQEDVLLKSVLA